MTPQRYFVVEGKEDQYILSRLLPYSLLNRTTIVAASGYSAALAAMRKLFSSTSLPIVFFFDTDSFSEDNIAENKQFIISYVKNKPILVPMIPEVEILFFYKKELLEQILNQEISDELWQKGQTQPKVVLQLLTGNRKYLSDLMPHLTPDIIQQLQENPILKEIVKKLSSLELETTTA
jgi:hypothetical protein